MNLSLFLNGFKSGMKNFSSSISCIINFILLSSVYIIGVGLTAVFARSVNKHFLDMKLCHEKDSYWSDLNLKKRSIEKYYRQF